MSELINKEHSTLTALHGPEAYILSNSDKLVKKLQQQQKKKIELEFTIRDELMREVWINAGLKQPFAKGSRRGAQLQMLAWVATSWP